MLVRWQNVFHKEFGVASVENQNRMLKSYGFSEH